MGHRQTDGHRMIIVARRKSQFGEVKILRCRKNGSHVYCLGDWYQSQADRWGVSLACYIHAIYGLLRQAEAKKILVLGCAGGTLGTMLVRVGCQVTMVDIDPDAFVLAREFFQLAPEIDCHVGDGRAFLEQSKARFDAIVVDAFCRNKLPQPLCSSEFFRIARRRLKPQGQILFNAILAHDIDPIADMLAAGMEEAGLATRILDTPGELDRNAIILGGKIDDLEKPMLLVPTDTMDEEITAELEAMVFRERRAAHPIRDGDETIPRRVRRRS